MATKTKIYLDIADKVSDPGMFYHVVPKDDWTFEDSWITPLGNVLMGKPLQLTEAYKTTTTGNLTRFGLEQFNLSTTNFENIDLNGLSGNTFIVGKTDSMSTAATSATIFDENQGFWFEFMVYGSDADMFRVLDLWFGQFKLSVYSNGSIILFDGSDKVLGNGQITPTTHGSLAGKMVDLLILPYNRRNIMFWSNQGGGWVYTQEALPITMPDNKYHITDKAAIKFQFPNSKCFIQPMRLAYNDTWYATSPVYAFPEAPKVDYVEQILEQDVFEHTGITVVLQDPTGSIFEADGVQGMIKTEIGGICSDYVSPFVYNAGFRYDNNIHDKTTNLLDISSDLSVAQIDMCENVAGRRVSLRLKDADKYTWTHDGTTYPLTFAHNRPCLIKLDDTHEWWFGRSHMPKIDTQGLVGDFTVYGIWDLLCKPIWYPIPGDGRNFSDIIKDACKNCGIAPDRYEIDDCPIKLPDKLPDEDYQFLPTQGTTWSAYLMDINDSLIGWKFDVRPVGGVLKLRFKNPDTLSKTSQATYYDSIADAKTALTSNPITGVDPFERIYWNITEWGIEPKATRVAVYGLDWNDKPLLATSTTNSGTMDTEDPTLAPADRPADWLGEKVWEVVSDQRYTSIEVCNSVCHIVDKKLCHARRGFSFYTEWNPQLFPGDYITLDGIGDVKIISFRVSIERDTTKYSSRPTEYVVETGV